MESGIDSLGTLEIVTLQLKISDSLMCVCVCLCATVLLTVLKVTHERMNGLAVVNTYRKPGPIQKV